MVLIMILINFVYGFCRSLNGNEFIESHYIVDDDGFLIGGRQIRTNNILVKVTDEKSNNI